MRLHPPPLLSFLARARLWQLVRRELIQRSESRFPALDGVRALAALIIVYFHALSCVQWIAGPAVPAIPIGFGRWLVGNLWIGVDIFFVLSGFLIGRILLLQIQTGGLNFRSFYVRRASRIFPAYYFLLILNALVLARLAPFGLPFNLPWTGELERSIPNFLYVSNYYYPSHGIDPMPWTWSLCVEEHFYLVFPTILFLLFRIVPRVRLAALLTLAWLPVVAPTNAIHGNKKALWERLNWESHTHCDGLFVGALLAYLFVYHRSQFARFATKLAPVVLAAAFVCYALVFLWGGGTQRHGFFPVVPQLFVLAIGTALIITNSLCADNFVSRFLAHHIWYPIARVSYGMYLIHPFVAFWLISYLSGSQVTTALSVPGLLAFGTATALVTFLLASLLFLIVERPLLLRGARAAIPRASAVPAGKRVESHE